MKKKIIISASIIGGILLAIILYIANVERVAIKEYQEANVIFNYQDLNINKEMSKDDFQKIKDIVEGRRLYTDNPSCGFTENVSVVLDNGKQHLCFACDACEIIYWEEKDRYFKVTESEYEDIKDILKKYGVTFPCL